MFHFVPFCIQILNESKVTFVRIETFLQLPELKKRGKEGKAAAEEEEEEDFADEEEEDSPNLAPKKAEGEEEPPVVEVEDLTAAWEQPVASELSNFEKKTEDGLKKKSGHEVDNGVAGRKGLLILPRGTGKNGEKTIQKME